MAAGWRRGLITSVLLVVLPACAGGSSESNASGGEPSDDDCQSVSEEVRRSFSQSAIVSGAQSQGEVYATPSRAVPLVWFISVGIEGEAAVWATNSDPDLNDLGLAMVANDVARRHSDLGVDIPPDAGLPIAEAVANDPGGIAAAEACVS